jgi:hypothetical protein
MANIMRTIMPNIAWQCRGQGSIPNTVWEETSEYNFGLDYDDTHYYLPWLGVYHSGDEDDEQPHSWYNGWDSDN